MLINYQYFSLIVFISLTTFFITNITTIFVDKQINVINSSNDGYIIIT